jgi:hypothetical protein
MKVASLKLSVLSIAMLSTFSSHADNYLGTSVAEGDTALSGVTSGDKTVNDNQGNTQIYYGDGKAAIFVSQDANTYNYSNGGYPNADSTNVDMYISADKTQINSTSTIIKSGTQEVYNATAGDTTLTADDNITAKVNFDHASAGAFTVVDGNGGVATEYTPFSTDAQTTTIRASTGEGSTTTAASITVSSSGVSVTGGIDNNSAGITNAGAISGVTTLSASGTITAGAFDAGSGEIQTTGTVSGGIGDFSTVEATTGNITTVNSTTINNSGALSVSGTTTTTGIDNTGNITNSGNITTGSLNVTGTTTTAGIGNTGSLNQVGIANINASSTATTNVGTGGGNTNIGAAGSTNTILGTTNINTNGSAGTQIGNFGNSATIHGSNIYLDTINTHLYMDSGNVMLSNTSGQNYSGVSATNAYIQSGSNSVIVDATGTAVTGGMSVDSGGGTTELTVGTGTISVAGSTSINNNVNSATSINTGTSTGSVTIGNAANTTSLNSSINNIGTSVGYASTNNIGNTNAGTTTNAMGGNSSVALSNNSGSLSVASGGSYTVSNTQAQTAFGANTLTVDATHINGTVGGGSINVTNTSTTIGNAGGGSFTSTATPNIVGVSGPALIAGDAASQANVAGASYVNRLQGNTLVDGNMYINGTLVYTSNSSASQS